MLTELGDPRGFAFLHLWLIEIECTLNRLERAREHSRIADTLLGGVDDLWLAGYLAVNRSVLHYHSAELTESRRWAEKAVELSSLSGHRSTRRAAHSNLGYIAYTQGDFQFAEQAFQTAATCCEPRSAAAITVLANLAEVKLSRGDLLGANAILAVLSTESDDAPHLTLAQLATIRLALKEGNVRAAAIESRTLTALAATLQDNRLKCEALLLAAEVFSEEGSLETATRELCRVARDSSYLAPDLCAEWERIAGAVLQKAGAESLGRSRLRRAATTFRAIGHAIGEARSAVGEEPAQPFSMLAEFGCIQLDRIRALLEAHARPELFGIEAFDLLVSLGCSDQIELTVHSESESRTIRRLDSTALSGSSRQTLDLLDDSTKTLRLHYAARADPVSQFALLTFEKLIQHIRIRRNQLSDLHQETICWSSGIEGQTDSGALFFSESMISLLKTIRRVSRTNVAVLLTGETGSGKEIIARTLHDSSDRAEKPFVGVNCAAVPRDLLESYLFGHRKGAFSGAFESAPGVARAASGGTLFLDEIGELPLELQAKLLRFLELGEIHPVGESRPIRIDVRLVFATNLDLTRAVMEGKFRQDLFYRLNVIALRVPPLRERRNDIPALSCFFAERYAREFAKKSISFSAEAMESLVLYSWPGNVRQLSNEIRRLSVLLDEGVIVTSADLSDEIRWWSCPEVPLKKSREVASDSRPTLQEAVAHLERQMIEHALRNANGHVGRAAAILGVSRKGLYLKRQRYGLDQRTGWTS